ncbi:MAG: hypothetical protein ACREHV_14415 [Rhizomicrobium sp.]
MSHWKIKNANLDERETDFSADFVCMNIDTGQSVTITLQQMKGNPASDLVGACRALAQLLLTAATGEESTPVSNIGRLN